MHGWYAVEWKKQFEGSRQSGLSTRDDGTVAMEIDLQVDYSLFVEYFQLNLKLL